MECKNCGASYKLKALRCPYCESENLLGKMLILKRSETIKQYEEEQKRAKKAYVPYVASKLVNTLILIFLLLIIAALASSEGLGKPRDEDGRFTDKKAERYFSEGKYKELNKYMDRKAYFGKLSYQITQSALIYNDYEEFLTYRMSYIHDDPDNDDPSYMAMTMRDAMNIYQHEIGMYNGYYEKNEPQYEEYNRRIMAFWKGTMMCDDEEIEFLSNEKSLWLGSELTELCEKLKERRIEKYGN